MKKLITLFVFAVFTIGLYAQSGISTFKYEIRAPSIRIGGATKVKLDSIVQNVDTIKFYTGGTELKSNGSGIWTGTGIRLDTTLAKVTLGIDQVTNESKATMFNLPLFTGTSTFSGSIIPNTSATWYFGSNDNRWNGIYFSNTAFMNWGNNISISGISDRLEFISGNLDLNDNNLYSTGDIGTSLSRVNNLYVDSLFSNYSDITLTGYAPLNNPTFTGTVTMPDINLPNGTSAFLDGNINSYITFNEFQIDMNAHVNLGDYDLFANYIGDEDNRVEGGYFGFVAADTMITQSIGVADTAVSYGFFDNLNINNRPTVGIATVATTDDINDSIAEYLNNATIGVAAADSNAYGGYTTRTYVESLLGSGSGLSAKRLPFIIGITTGAPAASDSTVVHSGFEGKHIDLYRDGAKQYQQFTATNLYEGFRLSNDTIYVNPAWQANEQVMVDIIEPILWSYLSLEGEESSLLDGLNGYWKFDESSGTAVVDATGTQNGTTNATAGVAGKLNMARDFDAATDVVNIAYNANTVPSGADFSVAMWFKIDSLPSVMAQNNYLFQQNVGADPWSAHWLYVASSDDKLHASTRNTDGTAYSVLSTDALDVDTWYHVVFVNRGDGQTLQMYVNGTDVSAFAGTFTGTLIEAASTTCFGNAYSGASSYFDGIIDSPAIWNRALTSDDVTALYNAGLGNPHPFN